MTKKLSRLTAIIAIICILCSMCFAFADEVAPEIPDGDDPYVEINTINAYINNSNNQASCSAYTRTDSSSAYI